MAEPDVFARAIVELYLPCAHSGGKRRICPTSSPLARHVRRATRSPEAAASRPRRSFLRLDGKTSG